MKYLVPILIFLFSINQVIGQDSIMKPKSNFPDNSIFFEVAGNGISYLSINYERMLLQKKSFYLSGRAGVGYFGFLNIHKLISLPVAFCGIIQWSRVFATEIGVGGTYAYVEQEDDDYNENGEMIYSQFVVPVALAGIRVQSEKGFLFRATFTPIFTYDKVYPCFGLSFGYSFGTKTNLKE